MRAVLKKILSPGVAAWACWVAALGAVALAFPGATRAGALMARRPMLMGTAVLAVWIGLAGIRALRGRRAASALLHLGCACVMAGWLVGRVAERSATPERPVTGAMAMIAGDVSDKLWEGAYLTNFVGRLPFTVKLEQFFVERYTRNAVDIDAGREAPVREYRSRITVAEPGREPYVANVRVNQPLRVQGYRIYQMSWGQSQDLYGRPVTYTVLQFIRDPGLPLVYAGFVLLFAGVLLFALRVGCARGTAAREVPS
ncbi:MAG TPA: cytochrome c biogenesis protein ResB [Kiritimatiellia bacterium]|nr:cytochrome c biogenesis protein ResB [Kiritimatiellia bacterium]HOM58948.1 cytochrome c biogenesis protein ResB [Kiritimatiellia bacterium]HOR98184.1 cytochrome c biogenesis protein ResB [Kiritimatiellia bacterium]HPC49311.1 cytochrome c biogenesis protein ResB [Kiritimatiellia bacterium]HPK36929.1 cytochrome c biogenesis protein ResB [Kiritimatiellia bacterium]